MQNPRWYDDEWGWARRITLDEVSYVLRCLYFIWDAGLEMVVIKFGTHGDDVYENGN